jgi:hypothetical protein
MRERPVPPLGAGRRPAGLALLRWLEDESAPRLCRVSGGPGSGKTHLLAWLAAAGTDPATPATRAVHAVLPAEGVTVRTAVWLLAEQLHVSARTPGELIAALRGDPRRTVVAVADLDRAGTSALPGVPRRLVTELLDPLLELRQLRLVVDAADESEAARAFAAVPVPAVMDLDDPRWTDPQDFARWSGGAPGYPQPRRALRRGRDAAAWWSAVPDPARPALRTLALASRALTADEWALLPRSGGRDAVDTATAVLPPETPGRWRLYRDELTAIGLGRSPHEPRDLAAAVAALAAAVPRAPGPSGRSAPDFAAADGAGLALLLDYAVRAGSSQELLNDPGFLVHADPVTVTTAWEASPPHPGSALAEAWAEAGPALVVARTATERAAILRARLLGRDEDMASLLRQPAVAAPWLAHGARWEPYPAVAATMGHGPFAGQVVLADATGSVRTVDAADGAPVARVALSDPRPLRGLACSTEGRLLLLDAWGAVHAVDGRPVPLPAAPALQAGEPPALATALATVLATSGTEAALAVGDAQGHVRVLGDSAELHTGPVAALAATTLPGGHSPLLVSGGADGRIRLWAPGSEPSAPLDERPSPVTAVGLAATPLGVIAATAWADGLIRMRRLDATDTVVDLRLGTAVRALVVDGSGAVLFVLPDGMVRVTLTAA